MQHPKLYLSKLSTKRMQKQPQTKVKKQNQQQQQNPATTQHKKNIFLTKTISFTEEGAIKYLNDFTETIKRQT